MKLFPAIHCNLFLFLKKKRKRISVAIWARANVFKRTKFLKMKYYFFILLFIFFSSCKNEPSKPQDENQVASVPTVEKGLILFQENNCAACHQPDQKVIGPSLQEIANLYKKENGSIVSFLKEEADPIVDPKMYESMKINLQITKNMSDEELESLELYFLSHSK